MSTSAPIERQTKMAYESSKTFLHPYVKGLYQSRCCSKLGCYNAVGGFAVKIKFLFAVIISLLVYGVVFAQTMPFTASPSPATIPTPKSYLLGPGDELTVKVLGETQFDFVATVNEEGNIDLPFPGKPVVAQCRTEKEVRADISGRLSTYLKEPAINLQIKKNSRPQAMIYGEVNSPQRVDLYRKATLMEFISWAGGLKEEAGGTIQIFRTTPPLCAESGDDTNWKSQSTDPTDVPSRIYSLANLKLGKEDSNPIILPGDVIEVKRAVPVYVMGQVEAPQGIYLKEGGLSLTEAIAKVAGPKADAKTKDIKVYRLKPNGDPNSIQEREVLVADYNLIKSGKQKDIMLKPQDIVEVGKAKESTAMQILKFAIGVGKAGVMAAGTGGGYRVVY